MNRTEQKWSIGMWVMLTLAIGILVFGFVDCRIHTVPVVVPPDGGGGTGGMFSTGGQTSSGGNVSSGGTTSTSVTSTDVCDVAGQRLTVLNCPEAKTPDGTPYATFCRHARVTHLDIHPECIAKITSCSQVNSAYRGCP